MPPFPMKEMAVGVQLASNEERMRKDLRVFLHVLWTRYLNLPELTRMQLDIAKYIQHGPDRCIIEAFRGVGKSFLTGGAVAWFLWNNPQLKILVVSASKERADAFSGFVKKLIAEVPFLAHLKPRSDQRDSLVSFDVGPATNDQSPSVKSAGITGQITGSRADIIISDDVETPGNCGTALQRERLGVLVTEYDAILKPLETSRIIYLGTPQTEMSLYNVLLERGYRARVWPAQYPEEKDLGKYKGNLAPILLHDINKDREANGGKYTLAGKPTDPVRFSTEDLARRRLSYGRAGYALQFMLNTSLADADKYPLKCSDLIVLTVDKERAPMNYTWAADPSTALNQLQCVGLQGDRYHRPLWMSETHKEFEGKVLVIDPSGRGKDETGWVVLYHLGGVLYLVDGGGLKGGYTPENLEYLAQKAKAFKVNEAIVECNFGDGMYTELLKPVLAKVHPCSVEEVRSKGQKELRIIDTLEPVISNHKLVVDPRVIEDDLVTVEEDVTYSLFYQLSRITRDKGALAHDDRLDALAIAVAYFVSSMARDSQKAEDQERAKRMQQELDKFRKGILGGRKGPGSLGLQATKGVRRRGR